MADPKDDPKADTNPTSADPAPKAAKAKAKVRPVQMTLAEMKRLGLDPAPYGKAG